MTLLGGSGCSRGGGGLGPRDERILTQPTYRQADLSCSKLDVGQAAMDVPNFQRLLNCINRNGALSPIPEMLARVGDDRLAPLVASFNDLLFLQPKRLYEIESTLGSLEQSRLLDPGLERIAEILGNTDLVLDAAQALRLAYRALPEADRKHLLGMLRDALGALDPAALFTSVEWTLAMTDAPAFASLVARWKQANLSESQQRTLLEGVDRFLRAEHGARYRPIGRLLRLARRSTPARPVGPLAFLDRYLVAPRQGGLTVTVPASVRALELVLGPSGVSLPAEKRPILGFNGLLSAAQRPIACLRGTWQIRDPQSFSLEEYLKLPDGGAAREFLLRTLPLRIAAAQPTCEIPSSLTRAYRAVLTPIVAQSAFEESFALTRALDDSQMLFWLFDLFGHPELPSLVPSLLELSRTNLLPDLFLLSALPSPEARATIERAIAYLTPERFAALERAARAVPFETWWGVVRATGRYWKGREPFLKPWLLDIIEATYSTSAHPFLEVGRELGEDLVSSPDLIETLLALTEDPDFGKSLERVAELVEKGTLKELLLDMVRMLKRGIRAGDDGSVQPAPVPKLKPERLRRHALAAADLKTQPPRPVRPLPATMAACTALNLELRLDRPTAPGYTADLGRLLDCLNARGAFADIARVVRALNQVPSAQTSAGRSAWQLMLASNDALLARVSSSLLDRWTRATLDPRSWLRRTLQQAPAVVTPALTRSLPPLAATVLAAESSGRLDLAPLWRTSAATLRNRDFGSWAGYAERVLDRHEQVGIDPDRSIDPLVSPVLKRTIELNECDIGSNPDLVERRAREVVREFRFGVTPNERLPGGVAGLSRTVWQSGDLKARLIPLMGLMVSPSNRRPERDYLGALLETLEYYSAPAPGVGYSPRVHGTLDQLVEWLMIRSHDPRVITWFYDSDNGELDPYPRARLATTLDRLELVTLASSFDLLGANFKFFRSFTAANRSLQSLQKIAEAWGDEPPCLWPPEVARRYPNYCAQGRQPGAGEPRPLTLSETVAAIEKETFDGSKIARLYPVNGCVNGSGPAHWDLSALIPGGVGAEEKLKLKRITRSLYNVMQTISVLRDNLPGAAGPLANGLRVIRDVLFQSFYSSPESITNDPLPSALGRRNNLFVTLKLNELGAFRNISRLLWNLRPDHPVDRAAVRGFLELQLLRDRSKSGPERFALYPILRSLIDPGQNQSVLWRVLDEVLRATDNSREGYRNAVHLREVIKYGSLLASGANQGWDLAGPLVQATGWLLADHRDILIRKSELLPSLLASGALAGWVKAAALERDAPGASAVRDWLKLQIADRALLSTTLRLVDQIERTPEALAAWKQLWTELERIGEDSSLQARLRGPGGQRWRSEIFTFLKDPVQADPVRLFLADQAEARGSRWPPAHEWLELLARPGTGLLDALETLPKRAASSDVTELLELLDRAADPLSAGRSNDRVTGQVRP